MRAVLVDDEIDAIEVLQDLINVHCPEISIVGTAASVQEGIQLLKNTQPNLLFLDVQMSDGTGFDLLRCVDNQQFHTVFVSAYENYAIEAIKFQAMAYLLKPIRLLELLEVSQLIKNKINEQIKVDYKELLQNLDLINAQRIAIPTGKGNRYFKKEEIFRVEGAKNYSNVYTSESERPILVSRNLKQFELLLADHDFIRIHDSHLVNVSHIREYHRQHGGSVTLTDGSILFIGRKFRDDTLNFLDSHSKHW